MFYPLNIEKFIPYWKTIHKFKNYEKKKIEIKKLTFLYIVSFCFFSIHSNQYLTIRKEDQYHEHILRLINLYLMISFQNNWNQELLQNLDMLPSIIISKYLWYKKINKEKTNLRLFDLLLFPWSYMLGIDLKSVQNKMLNVETGKNLVENSNFNLVSNNIFKSLNYCFFADFSSYLQLLFQKKINIGASTKQNFSKFCFYYFIFLKAKETEKTKFKLEKEQIRLFFLKNFPTKSNYKFINSMIIKRKKL